MTYQASIKKLYYTIKASFWFVPVLMVVSSVMAAVLCVWLDQSRVLVGIRWIENLYNLDQETLRSLVNTIAGSMITVTSIAFSITIVSLTLASSQFGPRLIRNFMDDTGTQVVLGTFISNFSFCLVLVYAMSMQSNQDITLGFSIAWCLAATCFSVFVLIYFIHHVARSIQADNVVDQIYREVQSALDQLATKPEDCGNADIDVAKNMSHKISVAAHQSGYLQVFNKSALVEFASENGVIICFHPLPGDMLTRDIEIAELNSQTPLAQEIIDKFRSFFIVGSKRTPIQDPEYAIHQLVEIAVRALSPGVNDPYTAIVCVDKLSVALCSLTQVELHTGLYYDQQDRLRLHCREHDFDGLASAAFDQIRQYSATSIAVTIRLLESLQRLVTISQKREVHEFVQEQMLAIEQKANDNSPADCDLQDVRDAIATIKSALRADVDTRL